MNSKSNTFIVPSDQVRRAAMGPFSSNEKPLSRIFEAIYPHFSAIPKPGPSEWLSDHKEVHIPFEVFKNQKFNKVNESRNVIYIQPLESSINAEFLAKLQHFIETYYIGLKVAILPLLDVKTLEVASRINWDGHLQYHALQIINKMVENVPPDGYCMICVLNTDLYPNEQWNYVFGWALFKRRTGVFSFARYDENFYLEKFEKETDPNLLFYRSARIVAHEIGHMFHLSHCTYFNCIIIMNGINGLEEFTTKPTEFCPVCLRKLQYNIEFSIVERYEGLAKICNEFGSYFKKDAEFYSKLAGIIKKLPDANVNGNTNANVTKAIQSANKAPQKIMPTRVPNQVPKTSIITSPKLGRNNGSPQLAAKDNKVQAQANRRGVSMEPTIKSPNSRQNLTLKVVNPTLAIFNVPPIVNSMGLHAILRK